ncbi:MAG: NAD(P)-dependent oxidoreductase [Anaerolineales bacterium]|nr:NAD(P)-dependent oxidoreductase [Anaerolineales bacterium]
MSSKTLITGAFGKVGTALAGLPGEKVLMDTKAPAGVPGAIQGRVQDTAVLHQAMEGCQAIVHLAASPAVDSSWEQVQEDNIAAMHILLEAAREHGVERIVFASTNHTVGMVELENVPRIYEGGHGIMLTKDAEPRPDSYYGVSKLLGENLGRYYAEHGGPRFYALRIGSLHPVGHDHPYAEAEGWLRAGACERGDDTYELKVKRQKALWLSHRDALQLVTRCLEYDGPAFDIFYGVSNNTARWLDIDYARQQLGYQPQDNGAEWLTVPESVLA